MEDRLKELLAASALGHHIDMLGQSVSSEAVRDLIGRYDLEPDSVPDSPYDTIYYENYARGIALLVTRAIADTLFLYGRSGKDDFECYDKPLVAGLSFDSVKDSVRAVFGEPTMTRGPSAPDSVAINNGFDRYDWDEKAIHFSYGGSTGAIELVTLMARPVTSACN